MIDRAPTHGAFTSRTVAYALSLVLIFMIPWEGVVQVSGVGNGTKALGLAVGVFWLISVVATGRFRRPEVFHVVIYLFVLWNILSVFWSIEPASTTNRLITWMQLLGMVLIFWDLYDTRTALWSALQAYVLGAYVAVGIAFGNYLSGNAFYAPYQRFSSGGDANPDGFGIIVALGIPVAWYLAGLKRTGRMEGLLKFVNYGFIPTAFLGIALSGTRAALVAAIPGMVFGVASLARVRPVVRVAVLGLFTTALFVTYPYFQTLPSFQRLGTTVTEITQGDLNQRTSNWVEGIDTFSQHPFFGIGSNAYRSGNSDGKVAHNSFLSVLVEGGIIGFVLFGLILAIAAVQAWGQVGWDRAFWLTTLLVWAVGASTLTWEHRKATWLFLSLLVVSSALIRYRTRALPVVRREAADSRLLWQAP